jgi:hypothetical protein
LTTKVRILQDFLDVNPETGEWVLEDGDEKALEPGTIVEAVISEHGVAWYRHPETGDRWATPPGLFEIVEEVASK